MGTDPASLSIVHGPKLEAEPGLGDLTLPGYFRSVCTKYAEREALVFHEADGAVLRMSYAQVWAESRRLAAALVASGVGKDCRVGLLATNRPEWVTGAIAIALTGATCVALSSFVTPSELEQTLKLADVQTLLFERYLPGKDLAADLLALCPELTQCQPGKLRSLRLPYLRRAICIDAPVEASGLETLQAFLSAPHDVDDALLDALASEISPVDRAMIFFSSGSTGKPKGILQTHRAAAIQCWRWARMFALDESVRTWGANGFFWSGNFAMGLGSTFSAGGCLVLQRYFKPDEALRLMQTEKVTMPVAWPHQWQRLTSEPSYLETDLSSLVQVGVISPLREHPTVNSDWDEPTAAYGNTETLTINAAHPSGADPAIRDGNHGFPLPGNTIRIMDPLTAVPLPVGQAGEITVKGPTLMLGYLKTSPEDTFDEHGFFWTGDGGFVDEQGRLHWQGRLSDIIKTGGANVSPLEIDAVLHEHPGLKVGKTVGVPHETLGEIVVACVVPEPGVDLDEKQVRAYVGEQLSSYKVPRRVLFVDEADLKLTGSNKVKTADLRELAKRLLDAEAS